MVCIWSRTLSCLLISVKFHKVSNLKCLFISTSIASTFQIWAENLWNKTVAHWRCRTYGTGTAYPSKAHEFTPDIWWGSPFSTFCFLLSVLKICVWSCFLVLLTIILFVVLRRTLLIANRRWVKRLSDHPSSILRKTNVRPDILKRFDLQIFYWWREQSKNDSHDHI